MRKLKEYVPSRFMGEGSTYRGELADLAVAFIGCLKHTKGEWYEIGRASCRERV